MRRGTAGRDWFLFRSHYKPNETAVSMKTYQLLAAMFLISAITGCSGEEQQPTDVTQQHPIAFTPTSSRAMTRGALVTDDNAIPEMRVYAYYTGDGTDNWVNKGGSTTANFFDNVTLNNQGVNTGTNNWQYSPMRYWPAANDANVTFFAYAPAPSSTNGISVANTTGGLTLSYTVPTDCGNQPDLLFATPPTDLNGTHQGAVNLDLQHALTSVGFSATGAFYSISTITLSNVYTSGELTYDFTTKSMNWNLTSAVGGTYDATANNKDLYYEMQPIITENGYLMMIPQTLPANATLTVTASNGNQTTFSLAGQVWKAGQTINYQLGLWPVLANIDNITNPNSFVGAFWRYNETAERIIRMPNTGSWEAFVICTDSNWKISDFVLDVLPADYSPTMGDAISGNPQQITGGKSHLSGTGNVAFRIGINPDVVLSSAQSKPRYAVLLLNYAGNSTQQLIYLRQGEAPDVINGTAKFSAFNVSATESPNNSDIYVFSQYPTNVGGYKCWDNHATMYPAVGDIDWDLVFNREIFVNVCPTGYEYPTYNQLSTLIQAPYGNESGVCIGGLYADGYFDRAALTQSSSGGFNAYAAGSGATLSYNGFIVVNINTYASVFMPLAGQRNAIGSSSGKGFEAYYWTSTTTDASLIYYTSYCLYATQQTPSPCITVSMDDAGYRLDAYSIRPVLIE